LTPLPIQRLAGPGVAGHDPALVAVPTLLGRSIPRSISVETVALSSRPGTSAHLVGALRACADQDIYWSNEHFYRWLSAKPGRPSLRALFSRPVPIQVGDCRFLVRERNRSPDPSAALEKLAGNPAMPGAAVAWARWLAKTGRHQEALYIVNRALAGIDRTKPWDLHILRNQITAIERALAGRRVHMGLQRYLGDDDGYMAQRTCPIPFERFDLQDNGNASVCCAQWMPNMDMGNVLTGSETAAEIFNNEKAQAVRRSVLDGSFRYCDHDKCPSISGESLPEKDGVLGDNAREAATTGKLTFRAPSEVLLAFDKSCNLSCPSCRSHVITEKAAMQAAKEEVVESSVLPMLRDATWLHVNPAGELFVSRPLRRLLTKMNSRDYPSLKIGIISNGTLINRREWSKFPELHGMVGYFRVSTDGATKATFEKLRRGAQWEPFLENMHFLAELHRTGAIKNLMFSFTYQAANFNEMAAFVDLTQSIDPASKIIFEKLENWGTFDPAIYEASAVHRMGHPLHEEFLAMIRRPELTPPKPYLYLYDYEGLL
jgi:hypothetical protein